jgi:hypothetical protein
MQQALRVLSGPAFSRQSQSSWAFGLVGACGHEHLMTIADLKP